MRRTVPMVLTAVAAAVITLPSIAAASTGAASGAPTQNGVQDRQPVILNAVSTLSDTDAWAVGSQRIDINTTVTWIQHWDGQSWQHVPSPNPTRYDVLDGVDVVSTTDVWAVGATYQETSPVVEHWDGSSWSLVPAPAGGVLYSVSAVGSDDVWAVGKYPVGGEGPYRTWAEHWDGTAWSVVSTPNPDGAFDSQLRSVTALGADDVWAVGSSSRKIGSSSFSGLIEHWDGSSWQIVKRPHLAPNLLSSVTAVSPNDVWAVGGVLNDDFVLGGLTEHWDGHTWSVVSSVDGHRYSTSFSGVSATSSVDVWAVGSTVRRSPGPSTPHIEHWDGSRWKVVPGDAQPGGSSLVGVSAVSPTSAWTVGGYVKYHSATLMEQWDGSTWTERP